MVGLSALWLPIVLSAVIVFVASSLIHMMTPWHKSDFPKLANEDKVMDALRAVNIPAGDYMVPCPGSREEMQSPAFKDKLNKGPRAVFTILPGGPVSMGKPLILWFIYSLAISVFAAYVSGRAVSPGSDYLHVFRFAGVTAFLGYSGALWQSSIWYSRSWTTTIKSTIDGLLYGLLTAGTFGWLWPR